MTKSQLYITVLSAALTASMAVAEPTVTGKITHESAKFTSNGNLIGNNTNGSVIPNGKDVFKSETNARIYIDGELNELNDGATYHLELQAYNNSQDIDNYDSNESYTQRDPLREAYVDTDYDDILLRLGKQQVVWGTADGIKLLDSINPTDYSELVQNQMEDSRLPIWMINADKTFEDGGNMQLIISEQRENKIPGFNANGDVGHAFIMKGVDSITGRRNGFQYATPALINVASTFDIAAAGTYGLAGGFQQAYGADITNSITAGSAPAGWDGSSSSLAPFTGTTVDGFASYPYYKVQDTQMIAVGQTTAAGTAYADSSADATAGKELLYGMATNSVGTGVDGDGDTVYGLKTTLGNQNVTNLVNHNGTSTIWDTSNPTSAFEYMPNATFATFNTFAGAGASAGSESAAGASQFVTDKDAQDGVNVGWRYKDTTKSGLNYSFNLMRKADANPYIDLSWHDASSGNLLTTEYVKGGHPTAGLPWYDANSDGVNDLAITAANIVTSLGSTNLYQVDNCDSSAVADLGTCDGNYGLSSTNMAYKAGQATQATTILLKDSSGNYYGTQNPKTGAANTAAYTDPILRFNKKSNDITSIGGSFDTSIETEALGPVVIRGEALLNIDEMTPVVNRKLLAIGDLPGALKMKKGNMFRYVLGADITALTNMMISTQFIQMRNLDYVDNACSGTTQMGNTYDCSEYTADMSVMHLTNGLKKAEKNKEFYSLFLSKPFGESGQHRWNNIFMFEEGGGKWNRLDVEYTIDDNTIATAEYNKYFGDQNTQFGQFKNSSNIQVGLKYSF